MTNRQPETTTDREIVIARTIDAPRELVFSAFTDVRHLSHWWGPDGFTTTTRAFTFHEGGVWNFVMHAPDGSDYPSWITWQEIAPPERIALLHGESAEDPDTFEQTFTFADHGETTEITLRTVFPTAALRDRAVEQSRAVEGGTQTLAALAAYINELRAST
jgi:uncharacterized protein YndB with AHSA1/START domain